MENEDLHPTNLLLRIDPPRRIVVVGQILLAGAVVAIVFLLLSSLWHAVVASSLASSAFTVFLMPKSRASKPRCVWVSHGMAAPVGLLSGRVSESGSVSLALVLAGAVGIASLLMVLTSTPHPPAAGSALGLALAPNPELAVTAIVGAVVLSSTHAALSPWMVDIFEEAPRDR